MPDRDSVSPHLLVAIVIATVAAVLVFVIATDVFPYHSSNHDEGVYLQQTAMLLDGDLWMNPGALTESVRPWFFVADGTRLYPKYQPVPALVFALGKLLTGSYRVSLAVVAFTVTVLTYVVGTQAFDHRTGIAAATFLIGAPLFLVNGALFLPYALTTALNLAFAVTYIEATQRESKPVAILAGVFVGVAFFTRPYTAILFALPFIAHALYVITTATARSRTIVLYGAVALAGLVFVGVTLAYNALVTGSALLFPYQAFAPLDGIGFGTRSILGYTREYTVPLALEANARVLALYATDWAPFGALGTAMALVGLGSVLINRNGKTTSAPVSGLTARGVQVVIAGIVVSVVLGNVAFWGNLNILGSLSVPDDGLVSLYGPYYHFDLLIPTALFGAATAVRFGDVLVDLAPETISTRAAVTGIVAFSLIGFAGAGYAVTDPIVDANREVTATYDAAYEPFEDRNLENALVFLSSPYGPWLNHPFQYLRNEPGLEGPVVYALSLDPLNQFQVLDAYPERSGYRYTYQGQWAATMRPKPKPELHPLEQKTAERLAISTTVGVPTSVTTVSVRVSDGDWVSTQVFAADEGEHVSTVMLTDDSVQITNNSVQVTGDSNQAADKSVQVTDGDAFTFDSPTELVVVVTLTEPDGGTLTYRQEVLVRDVGDEVEVVWPPERSVCLLVTECGHEGTYLPGRTDYPVGVWMESTIEEQTS